MIDFPGWHERDSCRCDIDTDGGRDLVVGLFVPIGQPPLVDRGGVTGFDLRRPSRHARFTLAC